MSSDSLNQNFFERSQQYEKRAQDKLRERAGIKMRDEEKECTYNPHINKGYKFKSKERIPLTERSSSFLKNKEEKLKKLKADQAHSKQLIAKSECTFSPRINQRSKNMY